MPLPDGAKNGVMTFSEVDTYVYEVTEINDGQSGYTYDQNVYRITYNVTEKNGELRYTRTITCNGVPVSVDPSLPRAGFAWCSRRTGA